MHMRALTHSNHLLRGMHVNRCTSEAENLDLPSSIDHQLDGYFCIAIATAG